MYTSFYKQYVPVILSAACLFTSVTLNAQDKKSKPQNQEEIIIKKKTDKGEKTTIVIDGDKVTVNGKPITELNEENIAIKKLYRVMPDLADIDVDANPWIAGVHPPIPPIPPLPPLPWNEDNFSIDNNDIAINFNAKPMLGVYTEKDEKGAKVTNVVDDSPAAKAGLMKGDIITKVDDKKVDDPSSLADIIGAMEPDKEVTIYFLRDKKEKKISVKLGERKDSFNKSFNYNAPQFNQDHFRYKFDGQDMFNRKPKLGIRIQDVEEGNGVKVIELEDSSAAAKSGIKKDDIITNIDGTDIKNTDDAREKINEVKDKNTYPVKVQRNGTTVNIEVKIPKKLKTTDL
jgi:serine protease Do